MDKEQKNPRIAFLKLVDLAKKIYDYKNEEKDAKLKEERLDAINKLIKLLGIPKIVTQLFNPNMEYIMIMIKKNIFRPLPKIKKAKVTITDTGIEEIEPKPDSSWKHIRGIYRIFFLLIVNEAVDINVLKQFITSTFIDDLLLLFNSGIDEEREFLKNILHKLYLKLITRRKIIKEAISDFFHLLLHETHKNNGASEVIDIVASIISGVAVPIREGHIIFFKNTIVPLHKVQTSDLYFDSLEKCMIIFLKKERSLSFPLLEGLLKYWPFANHTKEALFLQEIEDVRIF